jgi:hypothetical protein
MLRALRSISVGVVLLALAIPVGAAAGGAPAEAFGQPGREVVPSAAGSTGLTGAWLDDFFKLDERAWALSADYFATTEGHRNDIDVELLEAARVWRFAGGLELQARGGLFHANGSRSSRDVFLDGIASGDSSVTGITGGGVIRFYVLTLGPARVFADGSAQVLYTPGDVFPAGGTGVNGLLRAGAGLSYDVSPNLTVEAAYHLAHVSNGSGLTARNPIWNGQGVGLGLRYRF